MESDCQRCLGSVTTNFTHRLNCTMYKSRFRPTTDESEPKSGKAEVLPDYRLCNGERKEREGRRGWGNDEAKVRIQEDD